MKAKQIIGLVVLVIGVIALSMGINYYKQAKGYKEGISNATSPFSGNMVGDTVSGGLQSQVSKYDSAIWSMIIGGCVFILVGGGLAICCNKKKKR